MHIHNLTLENFRSARKVSVDLDARLNVFVGANGTGKSTVLDAAVILLSWLVNRIASHRASGRRIAETDIKNGWQWSRLEIGLCLPAEQASSTWTVARARKGHTGKQGAPHLQGASRTAAVWQNWAADGLNLPLAVHYPVDRAVLDIPLRIRKPHTFEPLTAHESCLTGGPNFRTFFEWFRQREDLENENRKYSGGGSQREGCQFPDPQLEAVRVALRRLMPGFKEPTVRRSPLRMEIIKRGQPLLVNQLSDGEKCLMAMVGDLARRLAIANPARKNPLDGEGIVLIDEVDLHLHPRWQRALVPNLLKVFKRCQFLLSTHSPHVVTHVQPKSIFLLDAKPNSLQVKRPRASYGKTVERILEDLMGLETTRPDAIAKRFRAIYGLIRAGSLAEAQASIDALEAEIGADPELVKAHVLIKRKQSIGK